MNTEEDNQITRLIERLGQADRELRLIDLVDGAIIRTTFHFQARKFIESLMKQRQIIIRRGASHKNVYQMLKTIDHLRVNLEATGKKDQPMVRYFLMNEEDIRSLIPGKFPSKYYDNFILLRNRAREINQHQLSLI
jgi:hypothetical protein